MSTMDKIIQANLKWCSQPHVLSGGTGLGLVGLFDVFRSQYSTTQLEKVLKSNNITEYIFGKLGVILSIIVICLALAGCSYFLYRLIKPNRANSRKSSKFVMSTLFLGLMLFSILSLVYSTSSFFAYKSMNCDFWITLHGYMHGTDSFDSSMFYHIVRDWSGNVDRRESVNAVIDSLSKSETGLKTKIQEQVDVQFYGQNGTLETLDGLSSNLDRTIQFMNIYETALRMAAANVSYTGSNNQQTKIGFKYQAVDLYLSEPVVFLLQWTTQQLKAANGVLKETYTQLSEATLGLNSPLTHQAIALATAAKTLLDDVDYNMNTLLTFWERVSSLGYIALTLSSTIIILISSICILSLCLVIWFIFYTPRRLEKPIPSERIIDEPPRKFGDKIHVYLSSSKRLHKAVVGSSVVASCILFIIGVLLLNISGIGSDVCTLLDQRLFEQGEWNILPDTLIQSHSTFIDIHKVYDVCLHPHGDGDLTGSAGLRTLSTALEREIQKSVQFIVQTVNDNMNKVPTLQMVDILYNLTTNSPYSFMYAPRSQEIAPVKVRYNMFSVDDRLKFFKHKPSQDHIPMTCLYKHLPSILNGSFAIASILMEPSCVDMPFFDIKSMDDVLFYLHNSLQNLSGYRGICPNYVLPYCTKLMNFTDPYVISARKPNSTYVIDDIGSMLEKFEADIGDEKKVSTVIYLLNALHFLDLYHTQPVKTQQFNELLHKITNTTDFTLNNYTEFHIAPACNDTCTLSDFLDYGEDLSKLFANSLNYTSRQSIQVVEDFTQKVVIPTSNSQIELSHAALKSANCQFLGTAIQYGITQSSCRGFFPSITSTGLLLIIFSLFMLGAAFYAKAVLIKPNAKQHIHQDYEF